MLFFLHMHVQQVVVCLLMVCFHPSWCYFLFIFCARLTCCCSSSPFFLFYYFLPFLLLLLQQKKRLATVDKVLEEIRGGLSRRGVYAFIKLRRLLARRDYDNTGKTNLYDLTEVLRSLGLSVRDGDLVSMVRRYDPRQEGTFDYNSVLSAIRGEISNVRIAVVRKAYDKVSCFLNLLSFVFCLP